MFRLSSPAVLLLGNRFQHQQLRPPPDPSFNLDFLSPPTPSLSNLLLTTSLRKFRLSPSASSIRNLHSLTSDTPDNNLKLPHHVLPSLVRSAQRSGIPCQSQRPWVRLSSQRPGFARAVANTILPSYFVNKDDEIRSIEDEDYYFKYFLTRNERHNIRQRFSFHGMPTLPSTP